MNNYYVYMLRCFDGTFYVGITNDVDRRVYEHDQGFDTDCYTFTRRPVRLVYATDFSDVLEAIDWEKRLKRWSHRKKRALAEGNWDDVKRFSKTGSRRERAKRVEPALRSG